MSEKDVDELQLPEFGTQDSAWQYTGKGWRVVDLEQSAEQLRDIQRELAVRQAEIAAGGADGE